MSDETVLWSIYENVVENLSSWHKLKIILIVYNTFT